jgi:hypothetical protein
MPFLAAALVSAAVRELLVLLAPGDFFPGQPGSSR